MYKSELIGHYRVTKEINLQSGEKFSIVGDVLAQSEQEAYEKLESMVGSCNQCKADDDPYLVFLRET